MTAVECEYEINVDQKCGGCDTKIDEAGSQFSRALLASHNNQFYPTGADVNKVGELRCTAFLYCGVRAIR